MASGTKQIISNGKYSVVGLKEVDVNIDANTLAEGSVDITSNGRYFVAGKKEVNVQVSADIKHTVTPYFKIIQSAGSSYRFVHIGLIVDGVDYGEEPVGGNFPGSFVNTTYNGKNYTV